MEENKTTITITEDVLDADVEPRYRVAAAAEVLINSIFMPDAVNVTLDVDKYSIEDLIIGTTLALAQIVNNVGRSYNEPEQDIITFLSIQNELVMRSLIDYTMKNNKSTEVE